MLSVKVTCKECNSMFGINATNVKEDKIKVIEDNKELIITYYDCIDCGKRYMVQLDDNNTIILLNGIKNSMRKMSIDLRRGKINVTNKKRYDTLKKDLDKMRIALMIAYSDKHFIKDGKEEKIIIHI